MNPRTVILAFLAARYPAAYTEAAVMQRVNASGLLDRAATDAEVAEELRLLDVRFKLAVPELDRLSGRVYWTATEAGVLEWTRNGRPRVP